MKRTDPRFYLACSLLSTGLLIGSSDPVQAQLTGMNAEEFRYIEQPLALKVGITAAGIGLMSFELWWFLFSRSRAKFEKVKQTTVTSKGRRKRKRNLKSSWLGLLRLKSAYRKGSSQCRR